MVKKKALFAAVAVAVALSGCGKEEAKQTTQKTHETKAPMKLEELAKEGKNLPEGHPPVNLPEGHPPLKEVPPGHPPTNAKEMASLHSSKKMTKIDKPIHIPEEVQKTWKFAVIDIVDKTAGKVVKEEKVSKGADVKFKGLETKVLYIVPHLVLDNGYTSASNEPNNPAILVEVKENGKVIYAGPIYQKFPTMYNINHPRYEIRLKSISKG